MTGPPSPLLTLSLARDRVRCISRRASGYLSGSHGCCAFAVGIPSSSGPLREPSGASLSPLPRRVQDVGFGSRVSSGSGVFSLVFHRRGRPGKTLEGAGRRGSVSTGRARSRRTRCVPGCFTWRSAPKYTPFVSAPIHRGVSVVGVEPGDFDSVRWGGLAASPERVVPLRFATKRVCTLSSVRQLWGISSSALSSCGR